MQESSSASVTDPFTLIRTQGRHDNDSRNPLPGHIEALEAREEPKTKAQKAADLALDALDTLASSMASIGKVTGVPYLAESAGLVVTIVDIVAKMKGNKEKFESLVRRTANTVSIIYEEVVQKGERMSEELKRNIRNVHDQLQQIKKFCKKKAKEGRLLRALRRKSDADAIEEYEKRLTQALNDFNFRSQIGNSVMLDEIHRYVTAGQAAHRADGNVAPRALLEGQTEPPREDPRIAARLEEGQTVATTRIAEEPERQTNHTTATVLTITNGVQGRVENESLASESGAGNREREECAAGDFESQRRAWREPRVVPSEIMGTREENHSRAESDAQGLENEEDERRQPDRRLPPARVEEHSSRSESSLPVDGLPRRPHSWNLPNQPRNNDYPSPTIPHRNPDNNPFRNPDVLQRSKSGGYPRVARDDIRQSTRRAHTQRAGYDPRYGYVGDYEEPYYPPYATPPTSRFTTSPQIQMNGSYNVNSGNVGSTIISNSFNRRPAGHPRDKYRS